MTDTQPQFDVFLAHNSQDKPQVRKIAQELKHRHLKPWLDEEQIQPGRPFQDEIQQAIPRVKSAAIFLGLQGLGSWQSWELRSLISLCVKKNIPVIPILLPGVSSLPEHLLFLEQFRWISFSEGIDDENALDLLEWGITGEKPTQLPKSTKKPAVVPIEFEVATIEVQKSGFLQHNTELIIKRRRQQAYGFIENLGDEIALRMVQIPGGHFMMGAPKNEKDSGDYERPQYQVTISPFCLGKYPVTQAQWQAVAALPQVNRELNRDPSYFKGENRPVETVSWYDAVEFCDRLSCSTGKPYRLPSEAEWEYACRAGTTTPFHFGETITSELANYNGEVQYGAEPKGTYRGETTDVDSFGVANAFGLYDMHGNVWEWCADHWHNNYDGAPTDGTAWLILNDNDNQGRVLRGGAWPYDPGTCRSACRSRNNADYSFGFRVVCGLSPRILSP